MKGRPLALIVAGCVALAALAIGLTPTSSTSDGDLLVPTGTRLRPVGLLAEGRTVMQQGVAEGRDLQSIGVLLATYQRVNHGTLQLTVSVERDGRWQPVATAAIDETTLQDNAISTLAIPASTHIARGDHFQIELRSDGAINEAVTWLRNPDWKRDSYALTYNGQMLDGTAIIQLSYRPESGRLYRQVAAIWQRSTRFATPFWQGVFLVALAATLGSIVLLIRRPLGED